MYSLGLTTFLFLGALIGAGPGIVTAPVEWVVRAQQTSISEALVCAVTELNQRVGAHDEGLNI